MVLSEASYLSTGYANYWHEILKRLHADYDVMEFAAYGDARDPRAATPWKFFPTVPTNAQEEEVYKSNPINQFGKWKFEQACLEFKPDVVLSVFDTWYCDYIFYSPFRRFFKVIWMPTVDSPPQQGEWLDLFAQTDYVLTYSKFAEDLLKKRGGNRINLQGMAPPAANYDIFGMIQNRKEHQAQLGFKDKFVIGTVMRNQKRKLYPKLIRAFSELNIPNAVLYLHTTWPDTGWNIPELVKNSGCADRIYFTYKCQQCGAMFPANFIGTQAICKRCGNYSAIFPSTQFGVSREELAAIYNLFDLYVQYHMAEGFGIPLVEASACGVPCMATDHSATESVIRELGGWPIKLAATYEEAETRLERGIPDGADLVQKIRTYYNSSAQQKRDKEIEHWRNARKFRYDDTYKQWKKCIDQVQPEDWNSPPDLRNPLQEVPKVGNDKLVEWAIVNILGRPDLVGTHFHLKRVADLNLGACHSNYGGFSFSEMSIAGNYKPDRPYTHADMLNELAGMRQYINEWEQKRVGNSY